MATSNISSTRSTRINSRVRGLITDIGFKKYAEQLNKQKIQAYNQGLPDAIKETKKELANKARGVFDVKSKTFNQMFTGKKYNKKTDKLPATLFYTRSNYFSIFETGGTITPKNSKGLLIPFEVNGKHPQSGRNAKKNFKKLIANLQAQGKTFWRKIGSNLILFAVIDKTNSKSLTKYRRNFKTRNNLKQVKSGTAIPIAILKKSITIKKRFNFSDIAKNKFIPNLILGFERNLNLS